MGKLVEDIRRLQYAQRVARENEELLLLNMANRIDALEEYVKRVPLIYTDPPTLSL